MSRIGKAPIEIPEGVTVSIEGTTITTKGPKGELTTTVHPDIAVMQENGIITCSIARKSKQAGALWGTARANIANSVHGVLEGFKKELEMHGVGYRAAVKGRDLEISAGYSHPVLIAAPEGVSFSVDKNVITIEGFDKTLVGQIASNIRKVRKPEPYKGKGIRYVGEHVRRKVGKVVGASE